MADLELNMQSKLSLKSKRSICLGLLSPGIKDVPLCLARS